MKCLFRSVIFLVLVILSACSSYQTFNIDVMVPAEYSVAPEVKSVVLVDNSIPFRDTTKNKFKIDKKKAVIDTVWFDEFAEVTLQTLKEELELRAFYDSVYYHPQTLKSKTSSPYRALNWLQVDSICKIYNAEAIISFEGNTYKVNGEAGGVSGSGYYAYMDVIGAILWRGYNNLNKQAIYKKVQRDTISWQVSGYSLESAVSEFPELKIAYASLAEYQAVQATNHTTPSWKSEVRGFYDKGNYHFMQAADNVRLKQYGEAVKLWKFVYDNSKPKLQLRSAYNLAVASEIMGDFKSAQYWLSAATEIFDEMRMGSNKEDKARINNYRAVLKKRMSTLDKLKEQVGGGFE